MLSTSRREIYLERLCRRKKQPLWPNCNVPFFISILCLHKSIQIHKSEVNFVYKPLWAQKKKSVFTFHTEIYMTTCFILVINALFIPIFWGHFYFGPYISVLLLLVPNPINACYFSLLRHSTNRKSWRDKRSALLTQ